MRANKRQASKKAGSGKGRRRKLGTLALAKSVRKPLPPPSKPFKDKRAKPERRSWREEDDLG